MELRLFYKLKRKPNQCTAVPEKRVGNMARGAGSQRKVALIVVLYTRPVQWYAPRV